MANSINNSVCIQQLELFDWAKKRLPLNQEYTEILKGEIAGDLNRLVQTRFFKQIKAREFDIEVTWEGIEVQQLKLEKGDLVADGKAMRLEPKEGEAKEIQKTILEKANKCWKEYCASLQDSPKEERLLRKRSLVAKEEAVVEKPVVPVREIQELEAKKMALEAENQRLKAELAAAKQECAGLQTQCGGLEEKQAVQVKRHEADLEKKESELQGVRESYQNAIAFAERKKLEVKDLSSQLIIYKDTQRNSNDISKELRQQITDLRADIARLESQHQKDKEELNKKIALRYQVYIERYDLKKYEADPYLLIQMIIKKLEEQLAERNALLIESLKKKQPESRDTGRHENNAPPNVRA